MRGGPGAQPQSPPANDITSRFNPPYGTVGQNKDRRFEEKMLVSTFGGAVQLLGVGTWMVALGLVSSGFHEHH
jgi:hypothetical protein